MQSIRNGRALRWWVPAAVTRMWTIGRPRPSAIAGSTIRYR